MAATHDSAIGLAVIFQGKYGVRRPTKPANGILSPDLRIIRVVMIVDINDMGQRVQLFNPPGPLFARYRIRLFRTDNDRDTFRGSTGGVDQ